MQKHDDEADGAAKGASSVAQAVAALRTRWGMPLSYIEADTADDRPVPASMLASMPAARSGSEALAELLLRAPAYRCERFDGHVLLYPRAPLWDSRLAGAAGTPGTAMPRLQAAMALIARLRAAMPALADLSDPDMVGDSGSPVHADTVALPAEATVVEHLAALLGPDPHLVLSLTRMDGGGRYLHFERTGA